MQFAEKSTTGISMEELYIRGFHVYQDNWTPIFGEQFVKISQVTQGINMLLQCVKEKKYFDHFFDFYLAP